MEGGAAEWICREGHISRYSFSMFCRNGLLGYAEDNLNFPTHAETQNHDFRERIVLQNQYTRLAGHHRIALTIYL